MEVFQDTQIYIFCPENSISGGPDALHQLCYYLSNNGYAAHMVYFFSNVLQCPDRFKKYKPNVISYKDVVDDENNIIIAPESGTWVLRNYKNLRKSIWWLSYNNFDGLISPKKIFVKKIKNIVKFFVNIFCLKNKRYKYDGVYPEKYLKDVCHFCGSQYAYDKIKERRYKNVELLVEPLSLEYIEVGMSNDFNGLNRSDVIPYNPAKPSPIMEKLLKRNDIKFVPIKGMEITEIIELLRHTKLYIDFGEFPGPERLPKESVFCGTCLIVGKRNAAENDFDVAIPDKFKIVDYENEEFVVESIKDVLANYGNYIIEFERFRNKINNLEKNFIDSINQLFVKIY